MMPQNWQKTKPGIAGYEDSDSGTKEVPPVAFHKDYRTGSQGHDSN